MKTKFNDYKVIIRCPIHENIFIEDFVVPIIDTKEFQRLRRISQMGSIMQFYPSATHNRFIHSLGVYEIARKIVNDVVENDFSKYEKKLFMLSALLHDLGHGPLSHSFEVILANRDGTNWKMQMSHEEWTQKIILDPTTEIHQELCKIDKKMPQDIVDVLSKKYENKALSILISSQVDVDRMDYLLRDSYYTGTNYGNYYLSWILRSMVIKNQNVFYKNKSIQGLENYLFSRYFSYEQIYFNPKSSSFEIHLSNIIFRLKTLLKENPNFMQLSNEIWKMCNDVSSLTVDEYLSLDDFKFLTFISSLENCSDKILNNLSYRLRKHNTALIFPYTEEKYQYLLSEMEKQNYDPKYYLTVKNHKYDIYKHYINSDYNIKIIYENGEVKDFSEVSNLFTSTKSKSLIAKYIFVYAELGES